MNHKLNIQIHPDKFQDLLTKLEDLAKISDTIKLKIDEDEILMYSIVGETILLAFKSYLINTIEYLSFKEKLPSTLDIIISNAKRFVKNLNFIKINEKILLTVDYRSDEDVHLARFVQIKNGKLKIAIQGGEQSEIKDITKDILEKRINIKNSKWNFKISNSDFQDIKKLATINSDGKIIHLNVENKKVILSETSTWEFQVDDIENITDRHLMFNKNFLPSINDDDEFISFYIFENFILTKDDTSHLMISFEQDFNVED